jgi:RNA polymerase sigma-70 factor (ECF subfamily)
VANPGDRGEPDGDTTAEVALRRAELSTALATLSRDERDLVALKFEAGLANAEIGSVLGISESNVGTRLSRVVGRLRTAMA